LKDLVPIRARAEGHYVSFFRGSAIVMTADCSDAGDRRSRPQWRLSFANLVVATPERNLVFDITDFESRCCALGMDVKRRRQRSRGSAQLPTPASRARSADSAGEW